MAFNPDEHFLNLKGKQYLEVKWRVLWVREEHPDCYIFTEMIEHDSGIGIAVFKCKAGFLNEKGVEVYATGYGSETKKDFNDYLEKAESKAVGRALAFLGYGTAQASELDEGERIVDAPVTPRNKGVSAPSSPTKAIASPAKPTSFEESIVKVEDWLKKKREENAGVLPLPSPNFLASLKGLYTEASDKAKTLGMEPDALENIMPVDLAETLVQLSQEISSSTT